jgi:hypothetical protein
MKAGTFFLLTIPFLFQGCSSVPTGPSVLVLPGAHQNFATFTRDDGYCRQYALAQLGGTSPQASAAQTGIGAAAVGTAVGAASGAAIDGGYGASVGAGAGLIGGSAIGTGMGYQAGYIAQQRYDYAYIQCMYGHGHQVPVDGVIAHPSAENARTESAQPTTGGLPLPPSNPQTSIPAGNHPVTHAQGNIPLPPH